MADKLERKFWVVLLLTAVPVTDFVGVNWFYTRHTVVGLVKIALILLLIVLALVANSMGEGGWGVLGVWLIFFAIGVLWWIVDIFLVALRKRL